MVKTKDFAEIPNEDNIKSALILLKADTGKEYTLTSIISFKENNETYYRVYFTKIIQ